jgi:predicted DNA-binding protein (MmcQ/YjbR family)
MESARIFEKVRRMCLKLPGTVEVEAWGHPNFKAGGRMYLAFEDYDRTWSLAFRLTMSRQRALLKDSRFFLPRVGGKQGWICLALDDLDWDEVSKLVSESYQVATSERLPKSTSSARRKRGPATRR